MFSEWLARGRGVFFLFLSLTILSGCSHASGSTQETIGKIERYLDGVMDIGDRVGLSVSVYYKGEPLLEKGYGYANLEWKQKVTPDTVFEIASVSKNFTGMAIAQLVVAGKLSLEDPLTKYFPELSGKNDDITIRHLLTHTSGLGNFNGLPTYDEYKRNPNLTAEEYLPVVLKDNDQYYKAGDSLSYSNNGGWLLSHIVAKISGQPFGQYIEENIFEPLGMTRSGLNNRHKIMDKRASGYRMSADGVITNSVDVAVPSVPYGAGAIVSTAQDLQRYMVALHSGDEVSDSVRDIMLGEHRLNDGRLTFYTTGLLVQGDFQGHKKVDHGGTIEGFVAHHSYYPDDDIGIVVLVNSAGKAKHPLSVEYKIAKILFDIADVPAAEEVKAELFAQYSGKYRLTDSYDFFGDFSIFAEKGKLLFKFGGPMFNKVFPFPSLPLSSLGNDRLINTSGPYVYVFNLNDSSEKNISVSGLVYKIEKVH